MEKVSEIVVVNWPPWNPGPLATILTTLTSLFERVEDT